MKENADLRAKLTESILGGNPLCIREVSVRATRHSLDSGLVLSARDGNLAQAAALLGMLLALAVGCGGEGGVTRLDDSQVDHFSQDELASVDVLFVVDNSQSMEGEQEALAERFDAFMRRFVELRLDFHIGVISTDMESAAHGGRLQPDEQGRLYIDGDFSPGEVIESFRQRVRLGTDGSREERGLDALRAAIDLNLAPQNRGFLRPEARLALVVISDEDDHSIHETPRSIIEWLSSLKLGQAEVQFAAVVGPEVGCEGAGIDPGTRYLEVADAFGGQVHPLCEAWEDIASGLGAAITAPRTRFRLSRQPRDDNPEVRLYNPDGKPLPLTLEFFYSYDKRTNQLVFPLVPPPIGTQIFVLYDVIGPASPS